MLGMITMNGQVGVAGDIDVQTTGASNRRLARQDWDGNCSGALNTAMDAGALCCLILDDQRVGDIIVTKVEVETGGRNFARVWFKGMGPLARK